MVSAAACASILMPHFSNVQTELECTDIYRQRLAVSADEIVWPPTNGLLPRTLQFPGVEER
jgi:hypothetical protein